MSNQPSLHASIVAMISLASGIASRHPDMGLCQLERLRAAGIPEHQINAVIEIARHIRDEASQKMDFAFDEQAHIAEAVTGAESAGCCDSQDVAIETQPCCGSIEPEPVATESCGCTPTPSGQRCC